MAIDVNLFYREGEYWTIAYRGRLIRVRDMKGLGYVARLLEQPGARVPVRELVDDVPPAIDRRKSEQLRVNVTKGLRAAVRKISEQDPDLGLHLTSSIHTGSFCSYLPVEESGTGSSSDRRVKLPIR